MVHQDKLKSFILFMIFFQSINCYGLEVYIHGEVKKTSACCYVVKTAHGKYIKIRKSKKEKAKSDPFKFWLTMDYQEDLSKDSYDIIKGKQLFR